MKLKVLRNFVRASRSALLDLAKKVSSSMLFNATLFVAPVPSDEEYNAKVIECEECDRNVELAEENFKKAKAIRKTAFSELEDLLARRADYVDFTANGNWETLNASGFDISDPSPQSKLPSEVHNVQIVGSQQRGELLLNWDSIPEAKTYQISATEDVEDKDAWRVLGMSTKSSFTAKELESGKRFVFRVCAFNASGQGADSNYVDKIVP